MPHAGTGPQIAHTVHGRRVSIAIPYFQRWLYLLAGLVVLGMAGRLLVEYFKETASTPADSRYATTASKPAQAAARAPTVVEVISFDLEPGKWSGWQDFSDRYPGKRWRQISWRTPDGLIDLEYKNGPKFLSLSRDQDVDFGRALPIEFRARATQGGTVLVRLSDDRL